jgi:hypothetical protein
MANYRQIHTRIWTDPWFYALEPAERVLFIYLFSNGRANLTGVYSLPLAVMAVENKLDVEFVADTLVKFAGEGKAYYEDGWVWVPGLLPHNVSNTSSAKVQAHLTASLDEVPDACRFKAMWYEKHGELLNRPARPDPEEGGRTHTVRRTSRAGRTGSGASNQEQQGDTPPDTLSIPYPAGEEQERKLPIPYPEEEAQEQKLPIPYPEEEEQEQKLSIPYPAEKKQEPETEKEQEQEQEQEIETETETEQEQEHDHEQDTRASSSSRSSSSELALKLFARATGSRPNALDREQIQAMVVAAEKHRSALSRASPGRDVPGEAWVCEAIRTANASRDRQRPLTLNYASAILERWMQDGYKAGWVDSDAGRARSRDPGPAEFQTIHPWGVEDG